MSVVAAVVVVAFGLSLIAFPGVAVAKPAIAERFLTVFASSAQAHYVEQVLRVLIGAALVVRSPTMWEPSPVMRKPSNRSKSIRRSRCALLC
jgi:hypothetical protein